MHLIIILQKDGTLQIQTLKNRIFKREKWWKPNTTILIILILLLIIIIIIIKIKKIKVSPLQAMKAHGGCGCKGPHLYTAMALGRVMVAGTMVGRLYPWYSFCRRLREPQDQSGYEGVKKNLHPSDTQDWTRAVRSIAKCHAAWATLSIKYIKVYSKFITRYQQCITVNVRQFHNECYLE